MTDKQSKKENDFSIVLFFAFRAGGLVVPLCAKISPSCVEGNEIPRCRCREDKKEIEDNGDDFTGIEKAGFVYKVDRCQNLPDETVDKDQERSGKGRADGNRLKIKVAREFSVGMLREKAEVAEKEGNGQGEEGGVDRRPDEH